MRSPSLSRAARTHPPTTSQVEALETLYGHDNELHYLMSGVELLRDETDLLHEDLEVYLERGLNMIGDAGDKLAEELGSTARRAVDKGVVIPDTPCAEAALLGDVLSLEELLRNLAVAEADAARDMQDFARDCMEVRCV